MDPHTFQQQSETWFAYFEAFTRGFLIPFMNALAALGRFLMENPGWVIALIVGVLAIALLIKHAWKVGVVALGVVLLGGLLAGGVVARWWSSHSAYVAQDSFSDNLASFIEESPLLAWQRDPSHLPQTSSVSDESGEFLFVSTDEQKSGCEKWVGKKFRTVRDAAWRLRECSFNVPYEVTVFLVNDGSGWAWTKVVSLGLSGQTSPRLEDFSKIVRHPVVKAYAVLHNHPPFTEEEAKKQCPNPLMEGTLSGPDLKVISLFALLSAGKPGYFGSVGRNGGLLVLVPIAPLSPPSSRAKDLFMREQKMIEGYIKQYHNRAMPKVNISCAYALLEKELISRDPLEMMHPRLEHPGILGRDDSKSKIANQEKRRLQIERYEQYLTKNREIRQQVRQLLQNTTRLPRECSPKDIEHILHALKLAHEKWSYLKEWMEEWDRLGVDELAFNEVRRFREIAKNGCSLPKNYDYEIRPTFCSAAGSSVQVAVPVAETYASELTKLLQQGKCPTGRVEVYFVGEGV